MKRVLSLIMVLAMVLAMVPAVFAADASVLNASATADADGKYTHSYTPDVDGTLTVTVGNGTTEWSSDVMYFDASFNIVVAGSASGSAEVTYTAELKAGNSYMIRVWETNGAALKATPIKAVFAPAGEEELGVLIASGNASCTYDANSESYAPQNVKVTAPGNGTMIVKLSAPTNTGAKNAEWYCEAVSAKIPAHQAAAGNYRFDVYNGYEYTLAMGVYDAYEDNQIPPQFAAGKVAYEIYFLAGEVELKDWTIVSPAFNVSTGDAGENVITGAGDYTVTLDPTAKVTIFEFKTPNDGNGTYQFTAANANAEVTYWGPTTAAPSLHDKEEGVAQNVVSATVSNGQWVTNIPMDDYGKPIEEEAYDTWESSSILVGVSGVSGDVALTVVKTASLPNVEQDTTEDVDYVNVHTFPAGFNKLSAGAKVERVDVTEAHTTVVGADGYYHLDTVNGPILYVDTETAYCSLSTLVQGLHMNTNYVNAEGNAVKENLKSAMSAYVSAADENGMYPLTVDLEIFLKNYGWQDVSNLPYDAETVNEDTAWMALCRYEGEAEEDDSNKLTVGQNSIAVPADSITYTYTAAAAGDFDLTVDNGEAEIYLDGDLVAYIDVEGVIEGDLPVALEAGDVVSVTFIVFDDEGDVVAGNVAANVTFNAAASGEIVYKDLAVGYNSIDAEDVNFKYTAQSAGTLTLSAGAAIMGPVEIQYAVNGGAAKTLALSSSVELTLAAGDVVTINVTAEGYSSLNAAWSGESAGEEDGSLKLGDNAVETAAGLAGGSWTYTPNANGKLTVEVTAVALYDYVAEEYVDSTEGLAFPIFWNTNFSMNVGGNVAGSASITIDVTAGEPVEITLAHNQGTPVKATITLSMGEGGEGGEVEPDGSIDAPWIITELPWSWTVQGTHDNYFEYTSTEACTLVITHPADCLVSGLIDYEQAENGDYIVTVAAGETITLNPWTSSPEDVSYTYTMAVQTNVEPSEPNGTENNPYIIDEAPVTFNAVVAEDYSSTYYKFDATKAGAISDNAPEGAFVYYYVNGEMASSYDGPVTYAAGDEVKVEVYAWTAGTYAITLSDPTVAKIGDVIYTDLSDALDVANETATAAAPVTVVLVADAHEEKSYLTIDENVTLDMGAYDVYAKSLNVLTGGKVSGVEYKQGADWAKIHLPSASRMVMSGIVIKNDGSIGTVPVWDTEASCYVFGGAFFKASNYNVAVDETAKTISFKFFPSLRTDLMKGYFQDANEMRDNGLRLVLRLTWPGADENGAINGEAQQDFVYSSEFVKTYMEKLGSARFTFLLTGYDTMITDEALAEMTITPMIIADNGMVFAGETIELADYLQ